LGVVKGLSSDYYLSVFSVPSVAKQLFDLEIADFILRKIGVDPPEFFPDHHPGPDGSVF
jgi:hypothetical protein